MGSQGHGQGRRAAKRKRAKPVGIRPNVRIIFESDRRAAIPVPEGVRWRAERIDDVVESQPKEKSP